MAEERMATQVGSASRIIWPDMPPEEARKRLIALLDEWLADDSGYDEETLPELMENIDENRTPGRRLFDGEMYRIGFRSAEPVDPPEAVG